MIIRAKTFKQWMKANLKDSMQDIANHGADQGYPGLTYYKETCQLYDKFKEEIWDALEEDREDMGYKNIFELIATFGRADAGSDEEFKNLLVWYMAERIAREESDG